MSLNAVEQRHLERLLAECEAEAAARPEP